MKADEFKAALDACGMSAHSFARLCGIPPRTAGNYLQATPVRPDLAEWLKRRVRDIQRDPPPKRESKSA